MITRSLALSLVISVICLLVIGGPMANALFESPVSAPAPAATVTPASPPLVVPPLVARISWIVLGAALATGVVLTVSQGSHSG